MKDVEFLKCLCFVQIIVIYVLIASMFHTLSAQTQMESSYANTVNQVQILAEKVSALEKGGN